MIVPDPHETRAGLRRASLFRRTVVGTALAMLGGLVVMAALLAAGLTRADNLLDQLRRSQDQLAQVTRIQAQVARLRADLAAGADVAGQVAHIDESLAAYRRSVREETAVLGASGGRGQAAEVQNAERLSGLFADLKASVARPPAAPMDGLSRTRFEALADRMTAREQAEAAAASDAMGDLRLTLTSVAAAVLVVMMAVAVTGAWAMLRTAEIEAGRRALADIDANRRLFFSQLGHELRTPATVIRGEAEVALRDTGASAAQLREALLVVMGNSEFLQRRLEDMLVLAQADDGRLTLTREPVDLGRVVRDTAALAEAYVRASGLELAVEMDDDGRASLDGDASWLGQALLAVLDNAAKFAKGAQPIRLRLQRRGPHASLTVTDDGPGLDEAEAARIFEPWIQGAAGRARGGAGLGLSVARWVAEQHGGAIRAASPPGGGLTMEIELPVRP